MVVVATLLVASDRSVDSLLPLNERIYKLITSNFHATSGTNDGEDSVMNAIVVQVQILQSGI